MSLTVSGQLAKVIYQYRHSPNVLGLIRALLTGYAEAYSEGDALYTRTDIAESVGAQLDGIGEIVGRPRPLTEQIAEADAFAFAGGTGKGFSGIGRPDIGGRLVGVDGLIIGAMGDVDYRTLLRATIHANYADSTIDNIGEYVRFIIGSEASITQGVGFIDVTFPRPLGPTELRIIDAAIPVAAGIRVRYKSYSLDAGAFSFAGNVNGTGFGDPDGSGFTGLFSA